MHRQDVGVRVRKRRKWEVIVLGGIGVTFITFAGLSMHSSRRSDWLNEGYAQIKIGDTEDTVLGLMSRPDRVVLPGDSRFWSWQAQACVKQYQYEIRILPELWVIGFDSQGRVVQRDHNVM